MAIPILVIGNSGSGKSYSLKNIPNDKYAFFNVMGKMLPFKSGKKFITTKKYEEIKEKMLRYAQKGVKTIVIDDAGYLLTDALMNAPAGKVSGNNVFGYYREMATNFYDLLMHVSQILPQDVIVVFTMHERQDDFGYVKPKTTGKMLDEQVTLEGLFTIVLRSIKTSDGYKFVTNTDGLASVKSPEGLFDGREIDNDMNLVINKVREYYNIGGNTNE